MTKEVVVSYLVCKRCGEQGCHVEDNRGQRVISWTKRKTLSWCGCKGKKVEDSAPTERKSTARVEKAAQPRKTKVQQERGVVERRSGEPSKC